MRVMQIAWVTSLPLFVWFTVSWIRIEQKSISWTQLLKLKLEKITYLLNAEARKKTPKATLRKVLWKKKTQKLSVLKWNVVLINKQTKPQRTTEHAELMQIFVPIFKLQKLIKGKFGFKDPCFLLLWSMKRTEFSGQTAFINGARNLDFSVQDLCFVQ